MGLMRPLANCDFNHNAEHGSATTANVYLPCSKTGIITSDDFFRCVSISDGGYGCVIHILSRMFSSET